MFPTLIQAWILPAHVSVKASIFLGGSPKSFGQVCAAQGLKPWPFLRIRQTKSDTLFKAQNLKNNTQFKESRVSEHLRLECQPKMIALFNDGDRQNPTPSSGTYQSSPYRSTPPPPGPWPSLQVQTGLPILSVHIFRGLLELILFKFSYYLSQQIMTRYSMTPKTLKFLTKSIITFNAK